MKKLLAIFFLTVSFSSAVIAQQAEVIKFDRLAQLIESKGDKIKVINFWATWCGPCIKELPYFEKAASDNPNIDMYLISLDFVEKLDRVNNFISKKDIKSTVLLLDEMDYNAWIDKVDKSWSGSIPATLLINPATGKRKFVEKEMEEGELEKLITELSN